MFKIISSLTLSLLGLLAKAQPQTTILPPFHGLHVNNNITVVYTPGTAYQAIFETAPENARDLITRVQDGTLFITQNADFPITVKLTAPLLDDVQATRHAAVIATEAIEVADFNLALASGARFNGPVHARHAAQLRGKSGAVFNVMLRTGIFQGDFSAGAKANLSGSADSGTIFTHGNALCLARNFKMESAEVEATGLSEVRLCVNRAIRVRASDEAVVRYFGPTADTPGPEPVATISE